MQPRTGRLSRARCRSPATAHRRTVDRVGGFGSASWPSAASAAPAARRRATRRRASPARRVIVVALIDAAFLQRAIAQHVDAARQPARQIRDEPHRVRLERRPRRRRRQSPAGDRCTTRLRPRDSGVSTTRRVMRSFSAYIGSVLSVFSSIGWPHSTICTSRRPSRSNAVSIRTSSSSVGDRLCASSMTTMARAWMATSDAGRSRGLRCSCGTSAPASAPRRSSSLETRPKSRRISRSISGPGHVRLVQDRRERPVAQSRR